MKLYPIPGGTWAGTEADFKKACKARGIDAKTLRGAREVPTGKAELLEFLNFNAVDVYRTAPGDTVVQPTRVDPAALQAEHNPDPAAPLAPALGGASEIISRIENPGANVDSMVEFVARSTGHTLKRFASAVATAFAALAA
jgi:hypothetical protein